jgi:hypothetical protein
MYCVNCASCCAKLTIPVNIKTKNTILDFIVFMFYSKFFNSLEVIFIVFIIILKDINTRLFYSFSPDHL